MYFGTRNYRKSCKEKEFKEEREERVSDLMQTLSNGYKIFTLRRKLKCKDISAVWYELD